MDEVKRLINGLEQSHPFDQNARRGGEHRLGVLHESAVGRGDAQVFEYELMSMWRDK